MKISPLASVAILCLFTVSCSEKRAPVAESREREKTEAKESKEPRAEAGAEDKDREGEREGAPEPEEIGEDCVGLVRSTRATPPGKENKDCPQCPVASSDRVDVLKFIDFDVEGVRASETSCEAEVKIVAEFNPSSGGEITGGLVGWISPEQKERYARGETPAGQQVYLVKIVYTRTERGGWKAVEFDRRDDK